MTTNTDAASGAPKSEFSRPHQTQNAILFGMAAAGFATILSILGINEIDASLWFALYCFCVSIPLNLSFALLTHPDLIKNEGRVVVFGANVYFAFGALLFFLGVLGLLTHLSGALAVTFALASIIGFIGLMFLLIRTGAYGA